MTVLQGHIQIGQAQALGHQRNNLIHVWVGVHIVQTHPSTVGLGQFAKRPNQVKHTGLNGAAFMKTHHVFRIDPVGGGVLAHHQQLLHTRVKQALGFIQHLANRATHQVATHRGNDAKRTAVVTPFTDFQIRIVARREFDALWWNQISKRIVRFG